MKKKLLAIPVLVLLVTCVAMLFTACGGGINASVYTEEQEAVVCTVEGSKVIDGVDNYTVFNTSKNLVVFSKSEPANVEGANWTIKTVESKKLYNIVLDKAIDVGATIDACSFNGTDTVANLTEVTVELKGDFAVVTTTVYTAATVTGENVGLSVDKNNVDSKNVTIYNENLEKILSIDGDKETAGLIVIDNEFVFVGENYYRIKDGEIVATVENYKDASLPVTLVQSNGALGDYVFEENYNIISGREAICVYDVNTLSLVNIYVIPSYYNNYELIPFANGSLLVQANYYADQMSDKYDYLASSSKQILDTFIVDVDGDVKDIDCEYILNDNVTAGSETLIMDYDAVVVVNEKIENSRKVAIIPIMLGLDDNGDISVVENIVDNQLVQTGSYNLYTNKLANGNYVVADVLGTYHLFDKNGKLIKSLNSATFTDYHGNYIVRGDKYINMYTFEEYELPEGYVYSSEKGSVVIISKEDTATGKITYAKFVDGTAEILYTYDPAGTTQYQLYTFGYAEIITDATTSKKTVKVYDWNKTLLETVNDYVSGGSAQRVGDNYIVTLTVKVNDANVVKYYRVGA